jgi:hypothetical protein
LDRYNETELADAFHTFLPGRLEELRLKLATLPRRKAVLQLASVHEAISEM